MTDSNKLRDVITEEIEGDENINKIETTEKANQPKTEVQETTQEVKNEELERFAEKVETKGRTPEELDQIYADWNKKYTQTRQKEKEELRQYQQKLQEAEEKLKSLETRTNKVENPTLQKEQEDLKQQFDLGNLTVDEYTKRMRDILREDARSIAREEFTNLSSAKDEESNQNNLLEKFNRIDSRFDTKYIDPNSPEYNSSNAKMYKMVAADMAGALDEYISQNGTSKGFDVDTYARKFIQEFDEYVDSVVKSRVQQSTSTAQAKAQNVSRTIPKGTNSPSTSTQKRELRDLIESNIN